MPTSTTKEWIKKVKSVHGNNYDYSKADYQDCRVKIEIVCPEHGSWFTQPRIHLSGHGCPKCGSLLTQEQFLERAIAKHGTKYDYSKTIFTETRGKITIICPFHGEFRQKASNHLHKTGCPKCAHGRRRYTTEQFIEKARSVHGTRFDYSGTKYTRSHDRLTIICQIHGPFEQQAYLHLQGRGCRACKYLEHPGGYTYDLFREKSDLAQKLGIFYIAEYSFPHEKFIKIGITQYDAYTQLKSHWSNVEILAEYRMPLADAFHREQVLLHRKDLQEYRYMPRSLSSGITECFTLDAKSCLF